MSSSTLFLSDLKDFATNPISFMLKEYISYKSKVKEGFHGPLDSYSDLIDFSILIFRVILIFIFGMFGIYYSKKKLPNQSRLTQFIIALFAFGIAWAVVS
jgi:hypothetical protein